MLHDEAIAERDAKRKIEAQAAAERFLWDAVVNLTSEGYDQSDVEGIVSDVFEELREKYIQ